MPIADRYIKSQTCNLHAQDFGMRCVNDKANERMTPTDHHQPPLVQTVGYSNPQTLASFTLIL